MSPTSLHRPRAACVAVSAALVSLVAASPGVAQIATDRPDFVESSATVGAGAVQVETSVAFGRTGSGAGRSAAWTTPTLFRFGLGDVLELRLESDGWVRDDSAAGLAVDDGLADLAVGLKWHLSDESAGRPSTAILIHADLPSGSQALRGEGVRPSLRGVAEWTLPGGMALGLMPGIVLDNDGSSYVAGIMGAVVGLELTSTLRTFVEVAAEQLAGDEHGGTLTAFNTGLAFLLTPNVQLDTGFSWGISEGAQDFAWGVGLSVLRPGG